MWFGTADGLCRYDGSELKTFKYTARYATDVVNNFVRGKMLEDKSGSIWYTNETGIYKWDILKETVVKLKPFDEKDFNNAEFQGIALDDKDSMWIFSLANGIIEYNIVTGTSSHYPLPLKIDYATFVLKYITTDDAGNFWLRLGSKTSPFIIFSSRSHEIFYQVYNQSATSSIS